MTDLLERLRNAERGSARLSAEVLTAVTGVRHMVSVIGEIVRIGEPSERNVPSVTESIDAAWALAEANEVYVAIWNCWVADHYKDPPARLYSVAIRSIADTSTVSGLAHTPALAICAALVAASKARE